jgi:zinc finger protein
MDCLSCKYHKGDIEVLTQSEPAKYTLEIDSEEDMSIRVIRSAMATIKIPHVGSIEGGENSNGFITNVEGVLNRIKQQIEFLKESSDDKAEIKKAKNLLKKLQKVIWGQEKCKLILEDKTGNSAIVSEKAVKSKVKK